MHVCFISSFIPRKCGIATYTNDLASEMEAQETEISIIALEDDIKHQYQSPVVKKIKQHALNDYIKAAEYINNSSVDIVHLQHEFGLFGGENGEYILEFAKLLKKPLVTTFHTILLHPNEKQKQITQELTRLSRNVIVMQEIAKDRLDNVYGINPWDINVIYHGVPEILNISQGKMKQQLGFENKFVLLSNNLLNVNKGLEFAIEAISKVKKDIPNIIYLIVGITHPNVKKNEGETYRKKLEDMVKKLKLEKNVLFINEYVSLEKIVQYLTAADIYITPYLEPEQITSGTLSYAIGAGKACISTEYVYAENMLSNERGILVPFRDSASIANAIKDIAFNFKKKKKIEKNAYELGKNMRWPKVANTHLQKYKKVINIKSYDKNKIFSLLKKPTDISYLEHLTDDIGIIQHGKFSLPDKRFGYSTDDVARGLIVVAAIYKKTKDKNILVLIKRYLHFLQTAQEENGMFHNFLSFERKWEDREDIDDTFGKTLWGLGFYLYTDTSSHLSHIAQHLFSQSVKHLSSLRDLRAAAYASLGMYYYTLAYDKKTDTAKQSKEKLIKLADYICAYFDKNHDEQWHWFEDVLTYDNFRIPQALFCAYAITKKGSYKKLAEKTLNFLTNISLNKDYDYFDFIGQNGWYAKNGIKANYDQQPLEAAGAIDAYILAYKITGEKKYKDYALVAYSWFFGNNRNHRPLFDKETKGIFDGLTPRGVNENEGAESVICFLITTNLLKRLLINDLKKT